MTTGAFRLVLAGLVVAACAVAAGCGLPEGDAQLAANTRVQLVDWHVAGFWVINCPVAWIRVTNYNPVPIKDIVVRYSTYDGAGHPLDQGDYTIDGSVAPGQTKNFIELYLGLVSLYSDRLSVSLRSVSRG